MEAAALYAFRPGGGRKGSLSRPCHKYDGQGGSDFEKGEADGTTDSIKMLERVDEAVSHTIHTPAA